MAPPRRAIWSIPLYTFMTLGGKMIHLSANFIMNYDKKQHWNNNFFSKTITFQYDEGVKCYADKWNSTYYTLVTQPCIFV